MLSLQRRPLNYAVSGLFLAGILSSSLDGLFTTFILKHGGTELNPIVRCLVEKLGVRVGIGISKTITAMVFLLVALVGDPLLLMIIVVLSMSAVIFGASSVARAF